MGLDMYLTASITLFSGLYEGDEEKLKTLNTMFKIEQTSYYGASGVELDVAYWRKSNQIHKWFVDNCQGGIDECQHTYVRRSEIEELLHTCTSVLEDKTLASELLPTQSGFFFGEDDYDEWYFKDLEYTKTRLTKILSDPSLDRAEFHYHSSW